MKRILVTVSLLVGAVCTPLHAAAVEPTRMQVWEITRTSSAATNLAVAMDTGFSESRTILGLTFLRHGRDGLKVVGGGLLSSSEGTFMPAVYAGEHRVDCPHSGVCPTQRGRNLSTTYYRDTGLADPTAADMVLAVTYGRNANVSLHDGEDEWSVRPVNLVARALWSTDTGDAAGVWHSVVGAEVFTRATLQGGRRGSVAIGVPPCAGGQGFSTGVGSATLSGGVAPVDTVCPRDVLRPSQVATKATTWSLTGTAVGLTAYVVSEPGTVRLLVIDL